MAVYSELGRQMDLSGGAGRDVLKDGISVPVAIRERDQDMERVLVKREQIFRTQALMGRQASTIRFLGIP